ncbi:hypothetical protein JW766_03865 [Candidatus Dojkabacteria bacterium]|nr:hypothetical protein [Candidatus Dojkabacteria bacterium]
MAQVILTEGNNTQIVPDMAKQAQTPENDPVSEYVDGIIQEEDAIRVPSLFSEEHLGLIAPIKQRNGLTTVVIHTPSTPDTVLTSDEQDAIKQFVFTQYLNKSSGRGTPFFDHNVAYTEQLTSEPSDFFGAGDIHVIVGLNNGESDGQIVGYIGLEGPIGEGLDFGDHEARGDARYYVEQLYGDQIFSDYPAITNSELSTVREMRRFVVRQRFLRRLGILGKLIALELGLGLVNITDQFREQIKVVVGDYEKEVAGANLRDVFFVPAVHVDGAQPDLARLEPPYSTLLQPRYETHDVVPFAFATADVDEQTLQRANALDELLDRDPRSIIRLLKESMNGKKSSLLPQ